MQSAAIFRPAAPATSARNLMKTALQCAVVWSITLALMPALIIAGEAMLGVPGFDFAGRTQIGAVFFVLFSGLNLRSGAVLSTLGRGTPLPLDCPRELVVSGPYAYVRNPMAIAGLGQGLSVAIWLGSWSVLAYVIAGIAVWQWGARPSEERDMERRFGSAYDEYRRAVGCWIPRRRPYAPGALDAA